MRNQIYGYLTDAQNVQWTIQFPNASVAARCAVTLAAICTQSEGKTLEKFDVGVGSGAVVAPEDQVTVSYIGFLGNQLPHTQVQFDANEQYSFVIGSEKTINESARPVIAEIKKKYPVIVDNLNKVLFGYNKSEEENV